MLFVQLRTELYTFFFLSILVFGRFSIRLKAKTKKKPLSPFFFFSHFFFSRLLCKDILQLT